MNLPAAKALAEIHKRSLKCRHTRTERSLFYNNIWRIICLECGRVNGREKKGAYTDPLIEVWIPYVEIDKYI